MTDNQLDEDDPGRMNSERQAPDSGLDATTKFELDEDDNDAIALAKKFARQLLARGALTPRQLRGIANALFALDRLPRVTSGAQVTFGVVHRSGNDSFAEMRYVECIISDECFGVSSGGSVYDSTVGSDTISGPEWHVELEAGRIRDGDIYQLEDEINELLQLGATLKVDDDSNFEMTDDSDE